MRLIINGKNHGTIRRQYFRNGNVVFVIGCGLKRVVVNCAAILNHTSGENALFLEVVK